MKKRTSQDTRKDVKWYDFEIKLSILAKRCVHTECVYYLFVSFHYVLCISVPLTFFFLF